MKIKNGACCTAVCGRLHFLLQVLLKETINLVKRDLIHLVIKVRVGIIGYND